MYRTNVALQCGSSVPTAEWLDSSVVGIAQLVAHKAGKCILCHEGGDVLFANDFGEDLFILCSNLSFFNFVIFS